MDFNLGFNLTSNYSSIQNNDQTLSKSPNIITTRMEVNYEERKIIGQIIDKITTPKKKTVAQNLDPELLQVDLDWSAPLTFDRRR